MSTVFENYMGKLSVTSIEVEQLDDVLQNVISIKKLITIHKTGK